MAPHSTHVDGQRNGSTSKSSPATMVPSRLYNVKSSPPSLEAFLKCVSKTTDLATYTLSTTTLKNIPIYDLSQRSPTDVDQVTAFQDELHHIFISGPGVVVLKHMFPEHRTIDATNYAFRSIIAREQSQASGVKGDHFAGSGKNDRIWNSFQKHALEDPTSFVEYYSNPWLEIVCEAWLGPAYRVTAQTNIVKPGGAAQVSHRDYHLGFQTEEACAKWPRATQVASQLLTLQGAVAHTDMPAESGPTRFLPFSQTFEEGYMAYRQKDFVDFFENNYVTLPLEKGDGVFFNPALFHAAGANVMPAGGLERSANLLQVSSAFAKPMESVNCAKIVNACWDQIKSLYQNGDQAKAIAIIKATGEGYPFPANLDKRPPAPGGMAPKSEQDIMLRGARESWTTDRILAALCSLRSDSEA